METIIFPNAGAASQAAARLVQRLVSEKPNAVLGLATGSTPLLLYQELIKLHRSGELSFKEVTTFNLDEYVGLAPTHPASYHAFMWENFLKHIDIDKTRVHIPDGLAQDIPAHCTKYEAAIQAAGGVDLQILGVGSDGHIGFNEPSSSLNSHTRIKTLTEETRWDNATTFGSPEAVPRHVITMGIGTILQSRMCVLLAFGKKKAQAIAKTVEGPIMSMVPASALQFHEKAKVFIDEAAASALEKKSYYNFVYQNKPEWQHDQ